MIIFIIAHKNKPCSHRCGGNMAYIIFHKDIFCYKKPLTYTHLMCIL